MAVIQPRSENGEEECCKENEAERRAKVCGAAQQPSSAEAARQLRCDTSLVSQAYEFGKRDGVHLLHDAATVDLHGFFAHS